jgi:hypothetical protein
MPFQSWHEAQLAAIASAGALSAGTQSLIILRQLAHSTDDEPDCDDDASAIAILTIGMGEAPSMEHNRRRAERSIDANQGPSGAFPPNHGARS